MSPDGARIGPGALVAVVGPSGAGKDTLLAHARRRLADDPRVVFPARVISRQPHHSEEHLPATAAVFADQAAQGRYALSWRAHELLYALPREVDDDIRAGRIVVANISRAAVATARERYARVVVVYIDAPEQLRVARLAGRARETALEIAGRLARTVETFDAAAADAIILNDGAPEHAGERLTALIRTAL